MIKIITMLEDGYESTFEHLAFRQLKNAYQISLICVPHDYLTLGGALFAESVGELVFMVPPGRVPSTEFADYMPVTDVTFVFGSPQENLVSYISDEIALHITTPNPSVDMMAVCVAAQVLHVHG